MKNSQKTISRKQLMDLYDISKSTVLKLERIGKVTPLYCDEHRRKAYYKITQVEAVFEPVE